MNKQSQPGSRNPAALLNEVQIYTIRQLYAEGTYKQITLAATFGVSQASISLIVNKQRWKTVN